MAKAETRWHPDNLKPGSRYKFLVKQSGGGEEVEDGIYKRMESMNGPNHRRMLMLWFDLDLGEDDGVQEVPFEFDAILKIKEMK